MSKINTFEVKGNSNYAALVVDVSQAEIVPLEGRDRVVGLKAFGMQAIVQKAWIEAAAKVVMFPAGAQLSEDFAMENNLHRHTDRNRDHSQAGYLEDNRRVKAIKFAGHRSDGLAVSLDAFHFLGSDAYAVLPDAPHGTPFDTFMGTEVSRKFALPVKGNGQSMSSASGQKKVRIQQEMFPEHFDTSNLFRDDPFKPEDHTFVTQKLHGTSVRLGNVPVRRDLSWLERLAKRLGVKIDEHEYKVVVGSRRTTKSIDGQVEGDKNHWYATGDLWTSATEYMHPLIPKNFLVFAEVIGWAGSDTPVQPGYTYDVPRGETRVYVYRVATVNEDGDIVDLPWRAVQRFCEARGWLSVPELEAGANAYFMPDRYMDQRYAGDPYFPSAVPLSDPKSVDEGVCIRADLGMTPTVRKAKSPVFVRGESAAMDKELVDLEEAESVVPA